jgi:hypothetical protein
MITLGQKTAFSPHRKISISKRSFENQRVNHPEIFGMGLAF